MKRKEKDIKESINIIIGKGMLAHTVVIGIIQGVNIDVISGDTLIVLIVIIIEREDIKKRGSKMFGTFKLKNFILMQQLMKNATDLNVVLRKALQLEMLGQKSLAWQLRQAVGLQMMFSGDINILNGENQGVSYSNVGDLYGHDFGELSTDDLAGLGELGQIALELLSGEGDKDNE